MKARFSLSFLSAFLVLVLGAGIACNQVQSKANKDTQINNAVQSKFSQDSGLQDKQLTVQTADGVVTIAGTVQNQVQRDAASSKAASVDGVKQVINDIQIAPPPDQTASAPPPIEEPAQRAKPKASAPRKRKAPASAKTEPAPVKTASAAPAPIVQATPAPSTPPPPPPPQKVTIPSGTTLAVRLVDTIDSEKSQAGQTFHATLDSPLAVDGEVVIPAGYDVEGHLVDVKSAGKFAGQSQVVLQLDRIAVGSKYYSIQTDQYKRQGSSRGKNTAEKVGAGAGIGAIIGAIAGGGKGAAIGAAAGGGLGGGVQAATKGQQIKLSSETVLNFTLQGPVTVVPTTHGPNANRPKLENN
jgi:hypothetical protein